MLILVFAIKGEEFGYDEKGRRSVVTRTDADGTVNAINKYYYENFVSLIG